jgi:1-aminocyclopropane-1-carboxylate deaminase/D-cysteine desulfhydrase-like pyridoxal-dependent ACC family enzyme
LNNSDKTNRLLTAKVSNHFGFQEVLLQTKLSSLMGMMALLRQVNHDLKWYKNGNSENKDLSLTALSQKMKS